jgi:hypothetical protein
MPPAAMKPPPPYKDMLLVVGVLLVLFGIGNWIIGALRTQPNAEYLREHPGPEVASQNLKADLLEAPDNEQQQRDVARAKLEFYQLVQSGGRFMVLLGGLSLLGGWSLRRSPRYLLPDDRL